MADGLNNIAPQPVTQGTYYDRFDGSDEGLLKRFDKWQLRLDGHYSEWQQEAREAFDLVAGRQWTSAEETEMQEKLRVPVVFNRIQPTIDAVAGAEIQGRQQIQYFPREVGDTAVSEILTQGAEYAMGECDGNEEDSDAFRDCLICGVGITELRPEPDDGQISIMCDRVDPLEVLFDPGKGKACFADARYLRREKYMSDEEFSELWPDQSPIGDDSTGKRTTIVDPQIRYENGMLGDNDKGDVKVCEWQWYEVERFQVASINGQQMEIDDEFAEANPGVQAFTQTRRVYYRAFVNGPVVLDVDEIETGGFTYSAITGKRDRNKGTFYGLVRPMKDPQKFANKFFSQILHIINSNAKGGVAVEEGAVNDIRNFEESWAQADAVTWMKDGAISQTRMAPKQPPAYPQGSDRLMQLSTEAIRDVTGVNQETLGLADRNQPGILEQQRKQAAYGILAVFFDSGRRYLKIKGRKLFRFMKAYFPPDKLIRIIGEDGSPQYVPMALAQTTFDYDIVVDEAPASPNQKMQTFQILTQLMPLLTNADLSATVWAELIKYSPLPASLTQKIATALMDQEKAEAESAPQQQALAQRAQEAQTAEVEASAMEKQANAAKAASEAQTQPQHTEATTALDRARSAEIVNRIVNDLDQRTRTDQGEY